MGHVAFRFGLKFFLLQNSLTDVEGDAPTNGLVDIEEAKNAILSEMYNKYDFSAKLKYMILPIESHKNDVSKLFDYSILF